MFGNGAGIGMKIIRISRNTILWESTMELIEFVVVVVGLMYPILADYRNVPCALLIFVSRVWVYVWYLYPKMKGVI